jgi:cation transport regulator ChaC
MCLQIMLLTSVQHVQSEDQVTWGVAYKVPDADIERVRKHLDYREKVIVKYDQCCSYSLPVPLEWLYSTLCRRVCSGK